MFVSVPTGLLRKGVFPWLVLLALFAATAEGAHASQLDDTQKEAIESIREITLQLILISAGVFALVGGFLATSSRTISKYWALRSSFWLFGVSIIFGLVSYGSMVQDLINNETSPTDFVGMIAALQWLAFAIGGLFLIVFLLSNARR